MPINIKNTTTKTATTSKSSSSAPKAKGSKSSTSPNTNQNNADSINLTDTASQLQQIEQSLSDIPIIDNAKVDSIGQSIKDGNYQINNEKVADRIIQSESTISNLKK